MSPGGVVEWKEKVIEIEAIHRRQGGFFAVSRETNVSDLAGLAGAHDHIHRPAGGKGALDVLFDVAKAVQEVAFESVGLKKTERFVQLFLGPPAAPVALAGKEAAIAMRLESRAETLLGLAVSRGDVEVVDAAADGLGHNVRGLFGRRLVDQHAAESEHRNRFPGPAERAPLQG